MSVFLQPEILSPGPPDLIGKRVLVVGGTHGIGARVASGAHALGATVVTVGRTPGIDLSPEITQVFTNVVENPEGIESLYYGADYVFNNIGMYAMGRIDQTPRSRVREVLSTNVETMHTLIALSILHASQVAVHMASRPTLEKYENWALYTLSKQAVITMTQAAAEEGAQKHYAIAPSRVDTKFRDDLFPNEPKSSRLSPDAVAIAVLRLFAGIDPSGQAYWIKEI